MRVIYEKSTIDKLNDIWVENCKGEKRVEKILLNEKEAEDLREHYCCNSAYLKPKFCNSKKDFLESLSKGKTYFCDIRLGLEE